MEIICNSTYTHGSVVKAIHLELAGAQQRQTAPDPEVLRDAERACSMNNKALHELQLMVPVRVVCEFLAFQDCILLPQCSLFPVFVQQWSTPGQAISLLITSSIHQAMQGKATPTHMYWTMTLPPRIFLAGEQSRKKHKIEMEVPHTNTKPRFVLYGATYLSPPACPVLGVGRGSPPGPAAV